MIFKKIFSPAPKFAALKYFGTENVGDEIQTIAAMQFLPKVDKFVDRERLNEFNSSKKHKIILNGWFMHRPEHWPPSPNLDPLLISFHLTRDAHAGFNKLMIPPPSTILCESGREYLKKHSPIGTRDLDTLKQLQESGIDAYFSGCLTLTLQPPPGIARKEIVYAVDIDEDLRNHFEIKYGIPIIPLTHRCVVDDIATRFEFAQSLLRRYAEARAVITSRLHCALPCLALSTPVLFVENATDSYRFDGLRDLLHRSSRDEILSDSYEFNPICPPNNDFHWQDLRDKLINTCQEFVGNGHKLRNMLEKGGLSDVLSSDEPSQEALAASQRAGRGRQLIRNIMAARR